MKTIIGILAFLWFVGWGYWFLYERGHIRFNPSKEVSEEEDVLPDSVVSDTVFEFSGGIPDFSLQRSNKDISERIDSIFQTLGVGEAIQVITYYTPEERFTGGEYETLGIQRSEDLVKELRKKYASRIILATGIKLQPDSDVDTVGISDYFEIRIFDKNQPLHAINNNRYFVFFPFASENERSSSEISGAIDSLTSIWGNIDYKYIITGHTDSEATETTNYRLGMKRAKSIQAKLIEKGIVPEDITILSKGEQEPIASNASAEGRYLNRRAEILLQRK